MGNDHDHDRDRLWRHDHRRHGRRQPDLRQLRLRPDQRAGRRQHRLRWPERLSTSSSRRAPTACGADRPTSTRRSPTSSRISDGHNLLVGGAGNDEIEGSCRQQHHHRRRRQQSADRRSRRQPALRRGQRGLCDLGGRAAGDQDAACHLHDHQSRQRSARLLPYPIQSTGKPGPNRHIRRIAVAEPAAAVRQREAVHRARAAGRRPAGEFGVFTRAGAGRRPRYHPCRHPGRPGVRRRGEQHDLSAASVRTRWLAARPPT